MLKATWPSTNLNSLMNSINYSYKKMQVGLLATGAFGYYPRCIEVES